MLRINLHNQWQSAQFEFERGPVALGREPPEGIEQVVVEDAYVSRNQLRVELGDAGRVIVQNLGKSATLSGMEPIGRNESRTLDLPVRLTIGRTQVEIFETADDCVAMQTVSRPISLRDAEPRQLQLGQLGESPSADTLARWFETLLSVQKASAGTSAFYQATATAIVDLIGLDRGLVLLRTKSGPWRPIASSAPNDNFNMGFSHTILAQMLRERRTFYQIPTESARAASLRLVDAVVASPIFDDEDNIIGAVYGSRDLSLSPSRGITPLEAQLVQVLAGAVSVGNLRLAHEVEAVRARIQLEEFVSPHVARELERNPDLLNGQVREVTVLFADVRRFSMLSESLGPRNTYLLVGEVMDRLTDEVLKHDGIIIDYHGDGMAAMWNAPIDQTNHAELACLAALDMHDGMREISQRWEARTGIPIMIGTGINTGEALVGNAGSRRRLKYGPRGHTVNVASRIEGATKQLGVPVLLSQSTRLACGPDLGIRKLCQVRVVGIDQHLHLYELHSGDPDPAWESWRDQYEEALKLVEGRDLVEARRRLDDLAASPFGQGDQPTRMLLEKVSAAIARPDEPLDPVLKLDQK